MIAAGQDFGSSLTGGGVYFWDEPVPATFQSTFRNIETDPMDTVQTVCESISASSATMLGWGVQANGVWHTDRTARTPAPGASFSSPTMVETSEMALSAPLAPNATGTLQVLMSTGILAAGKTFNNAVWSASSQTPSQRTVEGDQLGSTVTTGTLGVGPLPTRLYMRRTLASPEYFNFLIFGDSTTRTIRPLAASGNQSSEGCWHYANNYLRTNGKRVRIYSAGQGTATWAQIQARVRAMLPYLAGKVTKIVILVWTWNTAWGAADQVPAAWAEYLALEAEVIAAGFECSPMILNPYTNRNTAGQVAAFLAMRDNVLAHSRGIVLDSIMGDTSWPSLPASESEDNVHQNLAGATRTGPLVASVFLADAASYYPELEDE